MNRNSKYCPAHLLLLLVDVYRLEQIRNQRVGNNHHRGGTDPIFLGNIFHPKNRPAFLFLFTPEIVFWRVFLRLFFFSIHRSCNLLYPIIVVVADISGDSSATPPNISHFLSIRAAVEIILIRVK